MGAQVVAIIAWLALWAGCVERAKTASGPAPMSAPESPPASSLPSSPASNHAPGQTGASKELPTSGLDAGGDAPLDDAFMAAEYELLGHRFGVETINDWCWVRHRASEGDRGERVPLHMRPPCYLLTWDRDFARYDAQGVSDGVAVGKRGGVRAYRYPAGAGSFVVMVVVGGPTSDERASRWKENHCTGGVRAVIWKANAIRPSKVEFNSYFSCVESGGVDEKDYWILGHEK